MTKLEKSNCDKTKESKLWKTKNTTLVLTKLKKIKLTKLKNKPKWWQNLKDQILTKLKNSNFAKLKKKNCDNSKTQIVIVIKMTVVTEGVIITSFSKKTP